MFRPAVPAAAAASGATEAFIMDGGSRALRLPPHLLQMRLREAKETNVSWHTILNNHASTRPKCHGGGRLCHSLKACKEFGTCGSEHVCRLVFPNSYAPGDGLVVSAAALASTKHEAADDVCFYVFATLCADKDGLPKVLFRPAHWNVPIEALLDDIRNMVDPSPHPYQPLAVIATSPP